MFVILDLLNAISGQQDTHFIGGVLNGRIIQVIESDIQFMFEARINFNILHFLLQFAKQRSGFFFPFSFLIGFRLCLGIGIIVDVGLVEAAVVRHLFRDSFLVLEQGGGGLLLLLLALFVFVSVLLLFVIREIVVDVLYFTCDCGALQIS